MLFRSNRICEEVIAKESGQSARSGIMLTTDYRMWEFDKEFIDYILEHRIIAIYMEIATLFSVAYALNLPIGAIIMVSDMPLKKGGIKSKDSAKKIFQKHADRHLTLGLKAIEEIKSKGKTCRIKSEW